ncbi:DUF4307 domain-containing protein [Microbacterium sp. CIAB417]|uniref:DUF4307 domain-containing protein n=1 Tax=Microbacterium sp. CIAB417 TaxID=2860287 RepID=UPI001FABB79E|nr:DUF4307 domain-containing protein [Microbacterium sp. CIAB417]
MTTAQELDDRYGRTRRRRLPWIVGIVLAVAVVGWFSWSTITQSMNSVDADDLGFEVTDQYSVEVRFQVSGVAGKDIACAVEALDEEFGVVGWSIVEIPASDEHSRAFTERVPTVAEATTGLVNSCWVA